MAAIQLLLGEFMHRLYSYGLCSICGFIVQQVDLEAGTG